MSDVFSSRTLLVVLVFLVAGIAKGVTGMGLPTVAMGILGTLMAPVTAASLLIAPSFVTNIWQLLAGPRFTGLAARLWLMMLGIVLGTVAGSFMLTGGNTKWSTVGLGAALAIYAVAALLARPMSVPRRFEPLMSPIVGLTTGLITGGTGVFVIPAVPYLQSLGLDKEDLIQALGLSFTVSTIALTLGLARGGAFQLGDMGASTFAIVPSLAGMWLGQWIRHRISAETFRRWFLSFLVLLGLELVGRPFF